MVLESVILELFIALKRRKIHFSKIIENILSEELDSIYSYESFQRLPINIIVSIIQNSKEEIELIPFLFKL